MPATNNKNPDWALAESVAPEVGCSTMQAVRWIRTGTSPRNPLVAKAWSDALAARNVVARGRAARVVGKAHRRLSCPKYSRPAVRKGGRS